MPKITLDGQEVKFEAGQSLMVVAEAYQLGIPNYCWHSQLSARPSCEMCLVEVEGEDAPARACERLCQDGMVIHLQSERIRALRIEALERFMQRHPAECPNCDRAGECHLQDDYMHLGPTSLEFDVQTSGSASVDISRPPVPLGPRVWIYEDRCIHCTLCIRFADEIAQQPRLVSIEKKDRTVVGIRDGEEFDHPYSLNTVELCPVGALTGPGIHHGVRPWFLKSVATVCGGCGRGCAVWADAHEQKVRRFRGRDNPLVNNGWLCDDGRLSFMSLNSPKTTIGEPYLRGEDGAMITATWLEVGTRLGQVLSRFVTTAHKPYDYAPGDDADASLGVVVSPSLTNETLTSVLLMTERHLWVERYALIGEAKGQEDDLLRVEDAYPNRVGAELVLESFGVYDDGAEGMFKALQAGTIRTLLIIGETAFADDERWKPVLRDVCVVVLAQSWTDICRSADIVLPLASYLEQDGTFFNVDGRLQRIRSAIPAAQERRTGMEISAWMETMFSESGRHSAQTWLDAFRVLASKSPPLDGVDPGSIPQCGLELSDV
ncbi:MAG: (2Fe-2S)-binding protein [Myxococcales bacterium]|nr:(2Fe-2S)-binding protein [Myxococcales bacterium]